MNLYMPLLRILLALALLAGFYATTCLAGSPETCPGAVGGVLDECNATVEAADKLITAQDLSIKNLKQDNQLLMRRLDESVAKEPTLPGWMVLTLGIVGGMITTLVLVR